ncbi:MAG: riboflavin synthase [Thiotrichales bacterium]|nr:riboflavin synthase [Thiotrichales bacterium]
MFTGIVRTVGRIEERVDHPSGDVSLVIDTADIAAADIAVGDSICVGGVCLTAIEVTATGFRTDVSAESLARTTLGKLGAGSRVNLEAALTPETRLGGHLVSGHVDGIGQVLARWDDARSVRFEFRVPEALARYIAEKGSVSVDGTSLTVNGVDGARFDVNIVPHTLGATTLGELRPGCAVNIEVDQIARYVERLLSYRGT